MASASDTENVETGDELTKPPFLRRVRIRGYKSIAFCDVALEPLTILVGRNASGKSNFPRCLGIPARTVMRFNLIESNYAGTACSRKNQRNAVRVATGRGHIST